MKELHLPSSYLKYSIVLLLIVWSNIGLLAQLNIQDENQKPLIGVEVYNDTYTITGISDINGTVTLSKVNEEEQLNIKYLGYEDLKISWKDIIQNQYIVQLNPTTTIIDEILVVGRTELSKEVLPYQIETISQKQLSSTSPQTSADALAQHGNLYVQKSQMGGGSPIIRGFEANKVLLVIDGVRLNNAIYRNGHLQNAITIDQDMLEQMDIIFGPNSLMYGSDALGGVVHFKSKSPALNFDVNRNLNTSGNYYVRYASANKEKTSHIDFNIGGSKLASLTSISYSNFGDLRTGNNRDDRFPDFGKRLQYVIPGNNEDTVVDNNDTNIQVGTGYNQFDVLQKLLYHVNDDLQLTANLQLSTSSDVPRYDKLTERDEDGLRFAEWYYGPQNRILGSLSAKHLSNGPLYSKAILIAAYQQVDEDRIDRRIGRPARSHQEEHLNIWSFTADFQKMEEGNPNSFFYGVDVQLNDVNSIAYDQDIVDGSIDNNVLTRYPSNGSTMNSYGAYAQYNRSFNEGKSNLNTGLRYTFNQLSIRYKNDDPVTWPQNFVDGIDSDNSAASWSLGWTQKLASHIRWRALVSSAFRSPNIDDLAKIRVNFPEVTFPNPNLEPEKAISGEISLEKSFYQDQKKKGNIAMTGFYTRLSDAIIRAPFQDISGSDTFIDDGDTLMIVSNVNAQKATIKGVSILGSFWVLPQLKINGSINWTRGDIIQDSTDDTPLAHIPPTYGQLSLEYTTDRFSLKILDQFNAAKTLDRYGDSSDNLDLATPIGALSYNLIHVYGQYYLNDKYSIQVALENILDKHYRPFASGVSGSGFNAILSFRGRL